MDIDFINKLTITAENLKYLDSFFEKNSYSFGFSPSTLDTALLTKVKFVSSTFGSYPHLKRWFSHILSHSEQNNHFPKFTKVHELTFP